MSAKNIVFVVSSRIVNTSSKIDWPDLNYPGTGQTILRYLHLVDYEKLKIQLDGETGPWFEKHQLPEGTGFYSKIV